MRNGCKVERLYIVRFEVEAGEGYPRAAFRSGGQPLVVAHSAKTSSGILGAIAPTACFQQAWRTKTFRLDSSMARSMQQKDGLTQRWSVKKRFQSRKATIRSNLTWRNKVASYIFRQASVHSCIFVGGNEQGGPYLAAFWAEHI